MTDINTLNERTKCEQKIQEAVVAERARISKTVKEMKRKTYWTETARIEACEDILQIINNHE